MADVNGLRVMSLARQLVVDIYRATSGFPAAERFGLANQMRRAAVSIGSNIAEGAGRQSDREFRHFLTDAELATLTSEATDLSRMLHGLIRSLSA